MGGNPMNKHSLVIKALFAITVLVMAVIDGYWLDYLDNTVTIQLADTNGVLLPHSLYIAALINLDEKHHHTLTFSGTSGPVTWKHGAIPRGTYHIKVFLAHAPEVASRLSSGDFSQDQFLYSGVITVKKQSETVTVIIPNIIQKMTIEIAKPGFKIPETDSDQRVTTKEYQQP